jgi:hypothetical protein
MADEVSVGVELPLDADGFLRRACPNCEREFKGVYTSDPERATPPRDGGYFCPYCGLQAPPDAWFTEDQVALAQNTVATKVMGPMLQDFARNLGRTSRRGFGVKVRFEPPEEMEPLIEADDMRRVDFVCHPTEPVKVVDDWKNPIYCIQCGTTVS